MSGETHDITITEPSTADGSELWRIARDSHTLDLNSSYAYLLWCRDFAATSAVATKNGRPVGFVIGFVRPTEPETVVVWQIAVDADQRGQGIAGRLLDHLIDRMAAQGVRNLETTISPGNGASIALFRALAERLGVGLRRADLFAEAHFPDDHEPEDLYRIGPFTRIRETVPV
ncbi:diaminobutyrate acetyltransferase [Actinokineospora auranticolor]|uniref:L-2,4-diaminobutyric acid acetyltransferase n=1 Tax=Actinokineospora auranticolor TaxID=155976 RepID=A0A2S6GZM7_9PSEU|nr:diaminobutyrate acetyltransferase [Actinokineospora auranticolor]PPK70610.1 L-2,4-diaminobutyric acid acetyltransferase [Actinokineospora auranticolor]